MGVFTEQVQGLVSEERIKRQEREELKKEREKKKREKLRKEEIKQQLHFILSSYFTNAKTEDYYKIYVDLLKDKNKWQVINEITKKENEEYFLDINYLSILNKIKSGYIIQYKENEKQRKQKEKEKQKEEKEQEAQNLYKFLVFKNIIKNILYIFFIPILLFASIFYYLLKNI